MNEIERLTAIEELKLLKARYCRYCDEKDWDNYMELFTDDAVFDVRAALATNPAGSDDRFAKNGLQTGKANISAFVRQSTKIWSFHHCHTPEIEILSDTSARAIWAMEDRLNFAEDAPIRTLQGYGHYHETYTRTRGGWRISTLRLSRLGVIITRASA